MEFSTEKRVLVVDDDEAVATMLGHLLVSMGYEVTNASNLKDAGTLINNFKYDLVITDLCLTTRFGEEGLKVLELSKKCQPSTPVIMITGFGNNEIMQKAFEYGVSHYLEKPFDVKNLMSLVEGMEMM